MLPSQGHQELDSRFEPQRCLQRCQGALAEPLQGTNLDESKLCPALRGTDLQLHHPLPHLLTLSFPRRAGQLPGLSAYLLAVHGQACLLGRRCIRRHHQHPASRLYGRCPPERREVDGQHLLPAISLRRQARMGSRDARHGERALSDGRQALRDG